MTVFESPFLKIYYDDEIQTIVEQWKLDFTTTVNGDSFRNPLLLLLETVQEKKIIHWLCDNTEMKSIEANDQNWLEKYFYPELVANGIKKAVLVNAKNILGTGHAKNALQNVSTPDLVIEVFNKIHIAKDWLKNS